MPRKELTCSGYGSMWLIALFDLPVKTKKDRKIYTQFRKTLIKDGFSMIQYSVYVRFCASEEHAVQHRGTVRAAVPSQGQVRIISLTDRQFAKMENYVGRVEVPPEHAPSQLMLF